MARLGTIYGTYVFTAITINGTIVLVTKRKAVKTSMGKVKVTVSLSRSAVAALDRIGATRLEAGAGQRQVQKSALLEEAIELLRRKGQAR